MFPGLNVALGLGAAPLRLPPQLATLALLEDGASDAASLFLNHFLALYLKGGQRVALVSFIQVQNHYTLALRRLGTNLQAAGAEGRAFFADGLGSLFEPKPLPSRADFVVCQQHPERTIAALTRQIEAFVAAADTPVCLAIDGLSEALAAGIDEAALDAFLRSCRSLVETESNKTSLVFTLHDPDYGASETHAVACEWVYWVDAVIRAQSLQTGASRDIHGSLHITNLTQGPPAPPVRLQYKAHESGVDLFAMGTAAGHM